jgi:hypothetical protein
VVARKGNSFLTAVGPSLHPNECKHDARRDAEGHPTKLSLWDSDAHKVSLWGSRAVELRSKRI